MKGTSRLWLHCPCLTASRPVYAHFLVLFGHETLVPLISDLRIPAILILSMDYHITTPHNVMYVTFSPVHALQSSNIILHPCFAL